MRRKVGRAHLLGSALAIALGTAVPAWAHGITERVSVGPGGGQGDGISEGPALSGGGRFVAFGSRADNLVPGDTNGWEDIFVHDLKTGTTRRVSVGANGVQGDGQSSGPTLSADGRFVAFEFGGHNLVPGGPKNVTGCVCPRPRTWYHRASQPRAANVRAIETALAPCCRRTGASLPSAPWPPIWRRATPTVNDAFVHDRRTGTTWPGQR